jgi:acyl-CoA-binding protein
LSNDDKLAFYALFKQGTSGENTTKAPSRLKVVEKFKWDAWKKLGKMSKEEARKKYV